MTKYELCKAAKEVYLGGDGDIICKLFDDVIEGCNGTQLIESFDDEQAAIEELKNYTCEVEETCGFRTLITVYFVDESEYDGEDLVQSLTVEQAAEPEEITLRDGTYRRVRDGVYEKV